MSRRKRCAFCRELFWPLRRTESRQWACSKAECQRLRRAETQRRWRARHPEEARAHRYRVQIAAVRAGASPPLPVPPPAAMALFPWGEAKDVMEAQVFVTMAYFARFMTRLVRDEIRVQVLDLTGEIANLPRPGAKDETARAPPAA